MLLSAKTGRVRETTPLRRLSHKFEEMKTGRLFIAYVFPEPEEMDKLLPWSKDLPDEVRTKCKK